MQQEWTIIAELINLSKQHQRDISKYQNTILSLVNDPSATSSGEPSTVDLGNYNRKCLRSISI